MIEVNDITYIDEEKLSKEIEKQLKQLDNYNNSISFSNKALISQPFIFIGMLFLSYLLGINQHENFISYIFSNSGTPLILTSIVIGNAVSFFGISKFIIKNRKKIMIKKLNNNLSIQKEFEFNKKSSIEVPDVKLNEEKLNHIEEIELPEIIRAVENKSKPKTRTLKKDNNNVRK